MKPPLQSRVVYLFTTFPVASETFLQRELRAVRTHGVEVTAFSLWRGEGSFDGEPVYRFDKRRLAALVGWLPYWTLRRPRAVLRTVGEIFRRWPSRLNLGENLLGLAFALCEARRFERECPHHVHAVWASMPAAAALLLHRLTGLAFSTGAHAYDIWEDGGDGLLGPKLRAAKWVHTSTQAARTRLLERGATPAKVHLIRRGFDEAPAMKPLRTPRRPLRLLSVGRLVEKKGYPEQLGIYRALRESGLAFEARIAGGGDLREALEARRDRLQLQDEVRFLGAVSFAQVQGLYAWADVLVFTGKVAASGDRDGLPNVLGEAFFHGVVVCASPVSGVPEAVQDGQTGRLLRLDDTAGWVAALHGLASDDVLCERLRANARRWAEENFDARANAARLVALHRS